MLNVGLTGGIGSGKSTVAKLFQELGAYIIDFDAIAHFVEEPNGPAWKKIIDKFGIEILNKDHTINREKLGNIVFCDGEKLKILNGIVHPAVLDEWKKRIENIHQEKEDAIIISDIPLLIDVGLQDDVDLVIVVYAPPEVQITRIMKRNNFTREHALQRLHSQMPINKKLDYADIVISNDGPLRNSKKIVKDVWEKLLDKEKEMAV